jgi:hypothetical protein
MLSTAYAKILSMSAQKRFTITLDADTYQLLQTLAFIEGMPVAVKAREAIVYYIESAEVAGAMDEAIKVGPALQAARKRFAKARGRQDD